MSCIIYPVPQSQRKLYSLVVNSHKIPHTSSSWVSHGVSIVNVLEKTELLYLDLKVQFSSHFKMLLLCTAHGALDSQPDKVWWSAINKMWYWYNTVKFLQNTHNRHPIAHPWGQDKRCLFNEISDLCSAVVITVPYAMKCHIGSPYSDTKLYDWESGKKIQPRHKPLFTEQ